MLFISDCERLQISFRGPRDIFAPNGNVIETRPRVKARFIHGGAPDWAIEQAKAQLNFFALPQGLEPEQTLSVFDSVEDQHNYGWNDEEREALEQFLLTKPDQSNYIMVEQQRPPKPWEKYDELIPQGRRTMQVVAEQIVATLETTGIDPEVVLAYEHDNLDRQEIIDAVEAFQHPDEELEPDEDRPDEIVVSA